MDQFCHRLLKVSPSDVPLGIFPGTGIFPNLSGNFLGEYWKNKK